MSGSHCMELYLLFCHILCHSKLIRSNPSIDYSTRYDQYRNFKSLLEREKYLSCITETKLRNTLIQFRCGLLKIEQNEGRWQGINPSQRLCPLCKSAIENEFHFILICPLFANFYDS